MINTIKHSRCFNTLTISLCLFYLAACGSKNPTYPSPSSDSSVSSSSSSSTASSTGTGEPVERPSGPPVNTRPPNASGQTPAFTEQTRAPEVLSNIDLKLDVIADGLGVPWGLDFLPDGRMIVTLRAGEMRIITTNGDVSQPIQGLPQVYAVSQGGLLDVSVAPDFASSRMIYFSFSEDRGNGQNGTSVARARLTNDDSRLENLEVIFQQLPAWNSQLHFGSRLVWSDQGQLYVTLGERSLPEPRQFAQDINVTLGKVVRINADGSAPADNPFVNADGSDLVWSYGHRNVQGATLHPVTRELWTVEHGPRGGDEINIPKAGKNYGWPIITYGQDYSGAPIGSGITSKAGMEQPVYYWDPVIAPSDMTFYTGSVFPQWQGNLFIGSLSPGGIVRLMLDGKQVIGEERLLPELGRVRDIAQGPDGALYALSDSGSYSLVRITPR